MSSIELSTARPSLRHRVGRLLDSKTPSTAAWWLRTVNIGIIVVAVTGVVLATDPRFGTHDGLLIGVPVLGFALEYLARLWVAPERRNSDPDHPVRARWRWAISTRGLIDLAGAVLIPVAWAAGINHTEADLLGVIWVFKLARYSQGLEVLGRVIEIEAEPLIGVLFVFLVILLCGAVLAYLAEGAAQPDLFGTVPRALWWTIVTLTTTGYGDAVPTTPMGRLLGGTVMMCGIIVFALWAGILATGFSQEMRRRAFLRTWDLVARVPLFHDVGAAVIAEVAQRLRPREVASGTVIVRRGDQGDCMYFIVHGEIEVDVGVRVLHLTDGAFFGEMSLITGAPRSATATATRPTQLLILDIMDFRDMAARFPELAAAIHQEAEIRQKSTGALDSED